MVDVTDAGKDAAVVADGAEKERTVVADKDGDQVNIDGEEKKNDWNLNDENSSGIAEFKEVDKDEKQW